METALGFQKLHIVRRAVGQVVQCDEGVVGVENAVLVCCASRMCARRFDTGSVSQLCVVVLDAFSNPVILRHEGYCDHQYVEHVDEHTPDATLGWHAR